MCSIVSPLQSNSVKPQRRLDIDTYVLPDGTALLFDPATEAGHPLDVLSSLIWDYCDGTMTPDAVAQEVAELLPRMSDAAQHTLAVLAEFMRLGLLVAPVACPAQCETRPLVGTD
jgi:hypothetical protein